MTGGTNRGKEKASVHTGECFKARSTKENKVKRGGPGKHHYYNTRGHFKRGTNEKKQIALAVRHRRIRARSRVMLGVGVFAQRENSPRKGYKTEAVTWAGKKTAGTGPVRSAE